MSHSITVTLPAKSDPRWAALVKLGTSRPVKSLALKFMLTRMVHDAKKDPSPGNIGKAVDELFLFFTKNPKMIEADATTLFG